MADEAKKYLDYDGLKHLVEKLTNRIEAVGGDYLPLTGGKLTGNLDIVKALTVGGDTDLNGLTVSSDADLQGVTTVQQLHIGDGSRALVDEGGSLVVNAEASVDMREGATVNVEADVYMDLARLSDPSAGTALFLNGSGKVVEVTLDALRGVLDFLPLAGGTVTGSLEVKSTVTATKVDADEVVTEDLKLSPEDEEDLADIPYILGMNRQDYVVKVPASQAGGSSEQSYTRVTKTAYIWLADEYDDGGGDNWSYLTIQSNEGWTLTYDGSASGWLYFGDEGDPFEGTWNGSGNRSTTIWPKSRNATGSPRRAEVTLRGATSGQVTVVSILQLA